MTAMLYNFVILSDSEGSSASRMLAIQQRGTKDASLALSMTAMLYDFVILSDSEGSSASRMRAIQQRGTKDASLSLSMTAMFVICHPERQ